MPELYQLTSGATAARGKWLTASRNFILRLVEGLSEDSTFPLSNLIAFSSIFVLLLLCYTSFHPFCASNHEWSVIRVFHAVRWWIFYTISTQMNIKWSAYFGCILIPIGFHKFWDKCLLVTLYLFKLLKYNLSNTNYILWDQLVNKSQYDLFVLIQMSYNFAYNIFLGQNENMPVTGEFNNDKIIQGNFKGSPFCCPSYGELFMHIIFLGYLPTA